MITADGVAQRSGVKNVGIVVYAVCTVAGYILSYWDRPFFPDWCGDSTLDNPVIYDTMVRIAGSWNGVSNAFKMIVEEYGWKHIVLL